MRMTLICFVAATAVLPQAQAQSPEMPEPLVIVVDADGKPVVQVIDIEEYIIRVLFNFEGDSALFSLHWEFSFFDSGKSVYFSLDNCQGDVYMTDGLPNALDRLNQRGFVIWGPDGTTGTYRVFRSTSTTPGPVFPESWATFGSSTLGSCSDLPGNQMALVTAEEVLPNPLQGYHGKTVANPERLLTVKGGTRLP